MTPRQKDAIEFIRSYFREHGYGPTYDEMMPALNATSKSVVHRLITGLVRQGLLTRQTQRYRGVFPVELCCPSCGARFHEDKARRIAA